MDNKSLVLLVVLIVIVFIFSLVMNIIKKKVYLRLLNYIQNREFNIFDEEIKKWYIKFLFPQFNVEYMQLNSAILRNDPKMIKNIFETFDKRRLNKKQKEAVYSTAFNYYISLKKYNDAKKYVKLVNELENEQLKKEVNRIYDIYALKGHKYLDEMLSEVEMMEDSYKGVHEFLISTMYENSGDLKKAKEYKELSEKHIALLDQKISEQNKKA